MRIALYPSHHNLPFWYSPTQPAEMFDPDLHGKRQLTFNDDTTVLVKRNWLWPVLMGLHAVDLPLLAHVSAFCPCLGDGKWHFPKRVWVQITTIPTEQDVDGVPLVVNGKKVMVEHLWGGDNGTYTPYQFLRKEFVEGEETVDFWKDFFMNGLKEVKAAALAKQAQAQKDVDRFTMVPS